MPYLLCLGLFSTMLLGCGPSIRPAEIKTEQTQLQIREYQTRTFEANHMKIIMKASLNVLQDEGFTIDTANNDLGLLKGTKRETHVVEGGTPLNMLPVVGWFTEPYYKYDVPRTLEGTVNISEVRKNGFKVRVSFIENSMNLESKSMRNKTVENEKIYQDFFNKLDKAVFLQKENL